MYAHTSYPSNAPMSSTNCPGGMNLSVFSVYICVYMYVCVYTYVYMRTYIYMDRSICMHTHCIHQTPRCPARTASEEFIWKISAYICILTCVYTYMYTLHKYVYICTYMYMRVCTRIVSIKRPDVEHYLPQRNSSTTFLI